MKCVYACVCTTCGEEAGNINFNNSSRALSLTYISTEHTYRHTHNHESTDGQTYRSYEHRCFAAAGPGLPAHMRQADINFEQFTLSISVQVLIFCIFCSSVVQVFCSSVHIAINCQTAPLKLFYLLTSKMNSDRQTDRKTYIQSWHLPSPHRINYNNIKKLLPCFSIYPAEVTHTK